MLTLTRFTLILLANFLGFRFSYCQTVISGAIEAFSPSSGDSVSVVLMDGTQDTTCAVQLVREDGSFRISTDQCGTLLLLFNGSNFNTLQIPLVISKPTKITLRTKLARLRDATRVPTVAFADSDSTWARFAQFYLISRQFFQRYVDEHGRHLEKGGEESEFKIDFRPETEHLLSRLRAEHNSLLRQELIIEYIELHQLGSRYTFADSVRSWIIQVPPTSEAWVYHSNLPFTSYMWHKDGFQYVDQITRLHPSRHLRARMLFERARMASGGLRYGEFDSIYSELLANYPESKWSEEARNLVPILRVGDHIPEFDLRSMDDTSTHFTHSNLNGVVYLIDFWGTWCSACIIEMPTLHNMHGRFAHRGFTILSISNDKSADIVNAFRRRKWAMPWKNSLTSSDSRESILSRFGVVGFPTYVLVDSNGTILALSNDLRDDHMESTIEKVLQR